MPSFNREDLTVLLAPVSGPCVTICMPTHRRHPEVQQDPIRYRNLTKEAVAKLEEAHGKRGDGVAEVVAHLQSLVDETKQPSDFWNHQRDGLAVFASPEHFSFHCVPQSLAELAIVSDSFYVKPLLPVLFDNTHFNVLSIRRNEVKLWEGDRESIHALPMRGVPASLNEAIGHEWDDKHDSVNFHGFRPKAVPSQGGRAGAAGIHFHGSGGGERSADAEIERFFRVLDEAVLEHVSKESGLPLVLCAIDDYHSAFRAVSSNPHLAEQGIRKDPGSMDADDLRRAAWEIFEPMRRGRLDAALADVQEALGKNMGSYDLAAIGPAIVQNRVQTLLLEADRQVWGRVDRVTGEVEVSGEEGVGAGDLLDDLSEMALARGGDVLLLPADRMPVRSGAGAAYRF